LATLRGVTINPGYEVPKVRQPSSHKVIRTPRTLVLGRWISRDPIAEKGGLNLYAYVLNNPPRFVDPLGLDNMNLFPKGNPDTNARATWDATNSRPLDPDEYTVAGHGSKNTMWDSNGNPISAQKLADLISRDPDYYNNPRPIRLRSCSTADERSPSGDNFARELAYWLGQSVTAPTRNLNPGDDYSGDFIKDGGTWVTYP